MKRTLLTISIMSAAMLTGCGNEDTTAAKAAAQRAANDASARAAADNKAAYDAKAASNAKADADAKVASDRAGADARSAADAKAVADQAAADTKMKADAKIAADLKTADEAKMAADREAANTKAAADAKTAADLRAADAAKAKADAKTDAIDKAKADENAAKASTLLTQLLEYIKDGKLDLADTTLAQLDGMKATNPAALQERIEVARASLAAKKASASIMK